MVVQAADNIQKLGVQVALRQANAHLRHGIRGPGIGAAPLDAGHVVPGNIVIAVVVQPAFRVLQIFDMPVILVQRVINQLFIFQQHTHAQKEKACHKQGIGPCLLRKIIVDGDRVL